MERFAWKGRIKPGMQAEYKRRHDEIWPEMKELIHHYGGSNYSIYLDPELSGDGSKLLGYPCFIQYDPRDYEEDKQKYDTLLLQLDSDSGYVYWGFQGLGSFFINGQKLKEGDFSDVMYNWDCF